MTKYVLVQVGAYGVGAWVASQTLAFSCGDFPTKRAGVKHLENEERFYGDLYEEGSDELISR